MQMQKGICIEVEDNRSVFMLPNGHFMKGQPATELAVGEEGYFYPLAAKKKIFRTAIWAPVLAAVAVFVMLFSMFQPPEEAYAYVQVQINPGVEIGVGENGKTISLRGLNKDGEGLVSKLTKWENQPLEQVLNRIISLSVSNTTEEITITTVKEKSAKLSLEAAVIAVSSRAVNDHVEVQLKKATKDQWRKSVKEKIPVSKLVPDSTLIKSRKLNKEKENKNPDIKPENPRKGTGKEKVKEKNKTKDETKDKIRDKETEGKNEGKETKDKNKEKDNKEKEKEKENKHKADSLNKNQKGNVQREKEQKVPVPSVKPKEKANSKAQEKKSNTHNNAHKKKELPSKAKEKNKASQSSAKDKKEKLHPKGQEKKIDKPKQDKKSAEKKKVIPSQKEKKSKEKKQKKQSDKASKNKGKKE